MFKRMIRLLRRVAWVIGGVALVYLGIVVVLTLRQTPGGNPPATVPQTRPLPAIVHPPAPPPPRITAQDCAAPRELVAAAGANAQSRMTLAIAPFGVAETGWQFYEPLIARAIGSGCAGDSDGFAGSLRAWQAAHALAATGQVDAPTLSAMALGWLRRRPFVAAMRNGCPPAPDPSRLAVAGSGEAFGGKVILARPAALAAYRRMVAAARRDGVAGAPVLQIASAWRGPDEEAARCADDSCGTAAKAHCSAHRTGLAFDFVLDAALGGQGFSTAPATRLALSRTRTYRWLVAHAGRFGFVNYPYEPWHWEWTGDTI
jgi:hypothetical protein